MIPGPREAIKISGVDEDEAGGTSIDLATVSPTTAVSSHQVLTDIFRGLRSPPQIREPTDFPPKLRSNEAGMAMSLILARTPGSGFSTPDAETRQDPDEDWHPESKSSILKIKKRQTPSDPALLQVPKRPRYTARATMSSRQSKPSPQPRSVPQTPIPGIASSTLRVKEPAPDTVEKETGAPNSDHENRSRAREEAVFNRAALLVSTADRRANEAKIRADEAYNSALEANKANTEKLKAQKESYKKIIAKKDLKIQALVAKLDKQEILTAKKLGEVKALAASDLEHKDTEAKYRKEISALETRSLEYKATEANNRKEISALETRSLEYKATEAKYRKELSALETRSLEYKATAAKSKQEISALEARDLERETTEAKRKEDVSALEARNLESKAIEAKYNEKLSELEARNGSYKTSLAEKDIEILILRAKEVEQREAEAKRIEEKSTFEAQESSFQTTMVQKDEEIRALSECDLEHRAAKTMSEEQISALEAREGSLKITLAHKDEEIRVLETQETSLKTTLVQKDKRIQTLQAQESSLKSTKRVLAQKDEEIRILEAQEGSLKIALVQKDEEIRALQAQEGSCKRLLAQKDEEIQALQAQDGSLKTTLAQQDDEIGNLKAEQDGHKAAITEKDLKIQGQEIVIQQEREISTNMQSAHDTFAKESRDAIEDLEAKLSAERDASQHLGRKLDVEREKHRAAAEEKNIMVEQQASAKKEGREEISRMRTMHDDYLKVSHQANEDLGGKLKAAHEKISWMQSMHDDSVKDSRQANEEVRAELKVERENHRAAVAKRDKKTQEQSNAFQECEILRAEILEKNLKMQKQATTLEQERKTSVTAQREYTQNLKTYHQIIDDLRKTNEERGAQIREEEEYSLILASVLEADREHYKVNITEKDQKIQAQLAGFQKERDASETTLCAHIECLEKYYKAVEDFRKSNEDLDADLRAERDTTEKLTKGLEAERAESYTVRDKHARTMQDFDLERQTLTRKSEILYQELLVEQKASQTIRAEQRNSLQFCNRTDLMNKERLHDLSLKLQKSQDELQRERKRSEILQHKNTKAVNLYHQSHEALKALQQNGAGAVDLCHDAHEDQQAVRPQSQIPLNKSKENLDLCRRAGGAPQTEMQQRHALVARIRELETASTHALYILQKEISDEDHGLPDNDHTEERSLGGNPTMDELSNSGSKSLLSRSSDFDSYHLLVNSTF
ncbi:hypothetical protein MMC28_001239 [Mycoblastus sanguinarius]|nr:hypothetical protein [Mycoblastus sanguinarius]